MTAQTAPATQAATATQAGTTTAPPEPAALLDVRDLHVGYGTQEVVHGVSFAVRPGRTVALIGESGSGKSTIARAVLRLLPERIAAVRGEVHLRGRRVDDLSRREFHPLRGRVLGFVPQDPTSSLDPVATIGAQALEAASLLPGLDRAGRRAEVLDAFGRVGLPEPERVFASYPHQLSGGQLQRALIAIAILPRPGLLVADEPTSALDVTVQKQILDLLDTLRHDLDLGILLITHDLALAAERSDELVVLRDGIVQEAGPTAEVFASPDDEYTLTLQADAAGLHPDRFSELRAERDARHEADGGTARVALRHAERTFTSAAGTVRALADVGFAVPAGRTHALVGESGSGKSTAARAVLGLESLDAGELLLDGTDISGRRGKELRALRRDLQLVYQNPFTSLDPRFTVERTVREGLDRFRIGDKGSRAAAVDEALDAVRLSRTLRGRRVTELSGGQRQRVAIARSVVLRPQVLVLDEPTSALDVTVQAGILRMLLALQVDLGLSYLFISHDLAVVRQIADTVSVLRRGVVVEEGPVEEVFARPQDEYTKALIAAIPSGRRRARAEGTSVGAPAASGASA
ncbi:dipeptide ABC transporter ATP-binding protein [Brachybacterium sp. AOP25-B2-12]|uniref:dipeptide ABC transporter ATP-binding protein n=1 Tax=Brachybacterium sp. AOP25-B2-12 TaxID=3457710 RepID=UPI0040343BED